jgi:hypothetical protein
MNSLLNSLLIVIGVASTSYLIILALIRIYVFIEAIVDTVEKVKQLDFHIKNNTQSQEVLRNWICRLEDETNLKFKSLNRKKIKHYEKK